VVVGTPDAGKLADGVACDNNLLKNVKVRVRITFVM
jgi:hypothetical protein